MKLLGITLASCASCLGVLAWATAPEPPLAAGALVARGDAEVARNEPEVLGLEDPPRAQLRLEAPPPRVEVAVVSPATRSVDPATYDVIWPRWSRPEAHADALELAREYFHASEELARLDRELPADLDAAQRTAENCPDYFAALAERNRLAPAFVAIGPPAAEEPLPVLNLWARDDALARQYARWSREDLLVEQWRISRAAYAESKRVLDLRLEHGPYETVRRDASATWG